MHLLRKLVFAVGLLALLGAQQVMALGLGAAELQSALNQPLRADIQLTNLGDLEADDIIVRLASREDFEQAGLSRPEFYNQLDFEVVTDRSGGPIVRVTTREPVREPYLNFLVEARWSSGRLLREYTFLLDLPTFDDDRAQQPVEGARRGAQPPADGRDQRERSAPAPSRPAPSETEPTSRRGTGSDVYGPVGSSDTLWEIALRARPGRDVSVQQTMLAIQSKNPEAFIDGNINLLRKGQVLRLPSRDEIRSLGQRQAVEQVAQQNRDWSQGSLGAQLDAGSRARTPERDSGQAEGQVTLATPSRNEQGRAGQGGGASDSRGEELENELATTLEELDKTRRENQELSSRVEELEAQIDTMESLIEASNEQLRALQVASEQSDQQPEGEDAPAEDAVEAEGEGAELETDGAEPETEIAEAGPEEGSEIEPGAAPADEPEVEETRERDPTRVVRSAPEPTLMDRLMDNIIALGALLLALILAGGYFFWRRQQAQTDEPEPFDDDFGGEDFSASTESEEPGYDEDSDVGIDLAEDQQQDYDDFDTLSEDETAGAEAETEDVVGEADIYIAYGKLDQAEEMLLKGLAKEPQSAAILSKLLEVYAENQDIEQFDAHYATLLGTDDRTAIQRAGELRDSIPNAGEFDIAALESAGGAAASTEEDQLDVSDLSSDTQTSEEEPDLSNLDFNLDDELAEEPEARSEQDSSSVNLDDEFSFDLEDTETEAGEELSTGEGSRYDLSFEEPEAKEDDESDFALDLDLEEEGGAETAEPERTPAQPEEPEPLEYDLSLDEESEAPSLDDELEAPTLEAPALEEEEGSSEDNEFSFDFETPEPASEDLGKLDEDLASLDEAAPEPETREPESDEPVFDLADEEDFDPNRDVGDIDLAALDEEMGELDTESPAGEEASPEPETVEPEAPQEEQPEAAAGLEEDDVFDEALSDLAEPEQETETEAPASEPASEEDMDAELDFLADSDEAATKLDLARAYIDMGDTDGAKDILSEVSQEGNDEQKREADELLARID